MSELVDGEIALVDACLQTFAANKTRFTLFMNAVRDFFLLTNFGDTNIIHSVKTRLKDDQHLGEKIIRKNREVTGAITIDGFLAAVTDLAGVRVLHLHQQQFTSISRAINSHIAAGEWALFESPKAYTWDPEAETFFLSLGLLVERKESFYTSVHYVVKPRADSPITCEIQIRTLFEEVWGEIDHIVNYPTATNSLPCKEQIRVLAKLVGTGSRLADAIFRTNDDWVQNMKR